MLETAGGGVFEGDIAAAGSSVILRGGRRSPSFRAGFGFGATRLAAAPGDGMRNLDPVDQLTLEFAGTYRRYNACIMRTAAIGEGNARQQRMFEVTRDAISSRMTEAARPGNTIGDIDAAHRRVYDASGFEASRMAACGYSLGATWRPSWMDVPPMIYIGNQMPAQAGMVLFLHAILIDAEAGQAMSLGHTVALTEGPAEVLSRLTPGIHGLPVISLAPQSDDAPTSGSWMPWVRLRWCETVSSHADAPVKAATARITEIGETVGALASERFVEANDEAISNVTGTAFDGVPILLKDVPETMQRGLPWTGGSALVQGGSGSSLRRHAGRRSAARMGFVTLGIAKVPELCWWTTTQPAAFGPCRNPWEYRLQCRRIFRWVGSRGGERHGSVCHGTEDGGSIRIPASFCGVVGMKPSRGLVPLPEPHIDHRLHAFGLCRTVRDAAALLNGLATGSAGGMFARARDKSYDIADSLPVLRIAIAAQLHGSRRLSRCLDALESLLPVLAGLAHGLSRTSIAPLPREDPDPERIVPRCGALATLHSLTELIGRPIEDHDIAPFLLHLAQRDEAPPSATILTEVRAKRRAWAVRCLQWWDDVDVVVSPTVCEAPVTLASRDAENSEQAARTERRQMAFAMPANETGQPAVSLPLCIGRNDCPLESSSLQGRVRMRFCWPLPRVLNRRFLGKAGGQRFLLTSTRKDKHDL